MKKNNNLPLSFICFAFLFSFYPAFSQQTALRAFPGAEGFGASTPGGRGGQVLLVTNTNDSGRGSFRAACETKGPRMVVFRVGGTIDLLSSILITEPYLTIAGQTAPGDGICVRGYGVHINTHDVVVRFLRSRSGDTIVKEREDAFSVEGNSHHVILDHCSISWGTDETLSTSGRTSDLTVQWCIISEGLHHSIHHEGPHGMGTLARAVGGVTFHHNAWVHNNQRNPRLGDAYEEPPYPTFDVRNNVMYNYGEQCSGLNSGHFEANYVANYIKPGPDSDVSKPPIVLRKDTKAGYYIDSNFCEGVTEWTDDNAKMIARQVVDEVSGNQTVPLEQNINDKVTFFRKPVKVPTVTTSPAVQAYIDVLNHAGATIPVRDAVDTRIVNEIRGGTGAIIDSQWEVGGWPEYQSDRPLPDADRDGMPDEWEAACGLNPRDNSDSSKDRDGDGYTNIEAYINGLVKY